MARLGYQYRGIKENTEYNDNTGNIEKSKIIEYTRNTENIKNTGTKIGQFVIFGISTHTGIKSHYLRFRRTLKKIGSPCL